MQKSIELTRNNIEPVGFMVECRHSILGEIVLNNVTEIHYNFSSAMPKKIQIAFESRLHETGCVFFIDEVLEFEATLAQINSSEFM